MSSMHKNRKMRRIVSSSSTSMMRKCKPFLMTSVIAASSFSNPPKSVTQQVEINTIIDMKESSSSEPVVELPPQAYRDYRLQRYIDFNNATPEKICYRNKHQSQQQQPPYYQQQQPPYYQQQQQQPPYYQQQPPYDPPSPAHIQHTSDVEPPQLPQLAPRGVYTMLPNPHEVSNYVDVAPVQETAQNLQTVGLAPHHPPPSTQVDVQILPPQQPAIQVTQPNPALLSPIIVQQTPPPSLPPSQVVFVQSQVIHVLPVNVAEELRQPPTFADAADIGRGAAVFVNGNGDWRNGNSRGTWRHHLRHHRTRISNRDVTRGSPRFGRSIYNSRPSSLKHRRLRRRGFSRFSRDSKYSSSDIHGSYTKGSSGYSSGDSSGESSFSGTASSS